MQDSSKTEADADRRPRFRTAWLAGGLLAGLGWSLAALGLAGSIAAAWLWKDLEILAIGAVAGVSGLFMLVAGQLIRATIENARQTAEILRLLQSGPLQWAARPQPPPVPPPPAERTAEQKSWLKTPSMPMSAELRSSVASENVSPCVNPFCERLLPDDTEVCPHCKTRQKRQAP